MTFRLAALGAMALICGLTGTANAGDREAILESCARDTDYSPQVCDCIADTAPRALNPSAFEFFMAGIDGDEAEQARLRATMPTDDILDAAMFMTSAPAGCTQ